MAPAAANHANRSTYILLLCSTNTDRDIKYPASSESLAAAINKDESLRPGDFQYRYNFTLIPRPLVPPGLILDLVLPRLILLAH